MVIEGNTYYFYIKDHLGNNRIVANASGSVVQSTQYYPFGMAFGESTTTEQGKQDFKYNGKELDRAHELNQYDYAARYYDPGYGRFTTIDPLSEKFYNWSPYVYTFNNPMRFTDPTGMAPEDGFLNDLLKAINQAAQQILSTVGLSNDQLQSENPAVRADASQKREQAAETLHTVNETMLSVVPGADVAYKVANDREVTKSDVAWTVAGLLPVGKVGKVAKVAEEGTSIWSKTKASSAVENAFSHWKKHGKEFSEFQNAKQYVEGSKDFLHNSPSGTLTKVRSNGDILKYNPKSNTFGVMDATGATRTMFKPTDGLKYWKKQ